MKYSVLISAAFIALSLSACDKAKPPQPTEPTAVPVPEMPKQPGDTGPEKPAPPVGNPPAN